VTDSEDETGDEYGDEYGDEESGDGVYEFDSDDEDDANPALD
jgi:hypothetical protein